MTAMPASSPAFPRKMRTQRRPNPVFGPDYAIVRQALVGARVSAGLSQRELARRLQVSCSHIARIEGGQRRLDVVQFHDIAVVLNVDPAQLLGEIARQLAERCRATAQMG
ncbi:MAG TPA: helix-turn-helix domain-containing protein [Phenylobacterium sp.]|nr:helix-turn-helix domain-containing protein [Phenylobacterium sp.]